ncbi:MAG: hypothetical protein CDV28_11243 [Candidatus Electronema aureum]|uniref:Uncharacterized protein n=1 Tax=Candidatus Electronema aureum TaxID=2005002 RepID=A0A521G218_9BACT|nr:MAG: hypothetical protein CDV28_11243 [Candidatus Electronema aureum]
MLMRGDEYLISFVKNSGGQPERMSVQKTYVCKSWGLTHISLSDLRI